MSTVNNKAPQKERNPKVEIRNRAKTWSRIAEGLRGMVKKPYKAIPIAALIIALVIALNIRDDYVEQLITTEFIVPIFSMIAAVALSIFTLALIIGVITFIGTPKDAKNIDYGIASALKINEKDEYKEPFLKSRRPAHESDKSITNKNIVDFIFWSRWVPIDEWKKELHLPAILSALDVTKESLVDIKNGKKIIGKGKDPHIIIVRIDVNYSSDDVQPPSDPLF